jgi:hypothetical protein
MKTGERFHEENLEVLTSQNHWKGTLQIWSLHSDDYWSSVTLRFLFTLPVGWINDDTTVIPGLDPTLHVNLPVFIYASFIVKTQHHVFAGQRTCWSISRVAWNVSTLHCLKCDLCLIIKPTLQLTSKNLSKSASEDLLQELFFVSICFLQFVAKCPLTVSCWLKKICSETLGILQIWNPTANIRSSQI